MRGAVITVRAYKNPAGVSFGGALLFSLPTQRPVGRPEAGSRGETTLF
jgi:hypothetical protein